jgi:hypothetical protein
MCSMVLLLAALIYLRCFYYLALRQIVSTGNKSVLKVSKLAKQSVRGAVDFAIEGD